MVVIDVALLGHITMCQRMLLTDIGNFLHIAYILFVCFEKDVTE